MAALRAFFEKFDEIKVICCLHSQWQFLQSAYLEFARTRRSPSPPEWLRQRLTLGKSIGFGTTMAHFTTGYAQDLTLMELNFWVLAKCRPILAALLAEIGLPSLFFNFTVLEGARSNVSARPLPTWAVHALIQDDIP
jgi:hypothetical protein